MSDTMTVNYLFFLGIIIPSVATIILFAIFLYCWRKYKIRRDIMTKKHDPHGKYKQTHGVYARPPPPLPPRWIRHAHFGETPILNERDNEAYEEADNFCQLPESHEASAKPTSMYNTFHDSGMSELSESHYQCEQQCQQQCDQHRPYSSGSTDSEDSGFRSSRSGQYLHSAQNSNAQEIPLFRPIKSHKESCTVSLPKANICDRDVPDTICGEFHKNSSRHSKSKRRPSSCQKQCRQSVDRNANICSRPSSDSCIKHSYGKREDVSPSLIRLDPSPPFVRMDPSPSNCFMLDTSPSFSKAEPPPPYTFRGGSPEAIDLQQIETDVKLSNLPTISQQCRPLQVTMAMVHRPHQNYEPAGQRMSYSVV